MTDSKPGASRDNEKNWTEEGVMNADGFLVLGIVLMVAGTAVLAVSQPLLWRWKKKFMDTK